MRRFLAPLLIVTVMACDDDPVGPSSNIASIQLSPTDLYVGIGDTTRLSVDARTKDGRTARPEDLAWKSLDTSIAKVDATGLVTGVARGMTRIVASGSGVADTVEVTVLSLRFNVNADNACNAPQYRTGRVVAVGQRSIVVADTANPAGGFTSAEYRSIAQSFDNLIHPTMVRYFGEPEDIDGNRRVIIFYTSKVNELTPAGSDSYIGGFFYARDLLPRAASGSYQGCPGSNEAEIFYMLVPDPNGRINGNRRDKDFVHRVTLGTIAHEYQHLINASRRIYVNNANDYEETWLNEGLSHIAEELIFYEASRLQPGQNLHIDRIRQNQSFVDAFNLYQLSNFGRLTVFYEAPETSSAYLSEPDLAARAASWQFLRYLSDRSNLSETQFWLQLANSRIAGFANLQAVLGQDPMPLYRDWLVSVVADEIATDSRFRQPSWHYDSFMEYFEAPLMTRTLGNGQTLQVSLAGGGAAFVRFAVPSGGTGEIHLLPSGTVVAPGACESATPLTLAVGEVRTFAPGQGELVCLAGGASGAEFAVVPANLSAVATSRLLVRIAGYGIQAPVTNVLATRELRPAELRLGREGALSFASAPVRDLALEQKIRRSELEALSMRFGRGRRALAAAVAAQAYPEFESLHVSVVRTR